MCGRFEYFTYREVAGIVSAIEARQNGRGSARGHIDLNHSTAEAREQARPGSSILLFGHGAEDGRDGLEIAESTWGFPVDWSPRPVFNTRIESMTGGSAMWRDLAEQGRCIIPAAAFFEPHATETVTSPRTGRPMKCPYRFVDPHGAPLLLAGVADSERCSIVTCEPNRWVFPIHDRMPLILRLEEVGTWLDGNWASLADRSSITLDAKPEHPDIPIQLSLF